MDPVALLGWTGLIAVLPAAWFQVVKNFRCKSADGVSVLTFVSLLAGTSAFFIVSFFDGSSMPLRISFLSGALGSVVVLFQKYLYRKGKMSANGGTP